MTKKLFLLLFALLALPGLALAAEKRLLNLDESGTAIQGHDPVAYFTEGRAVKGDPKFFSVYNGARYRFASAENKKLFDADPNKYEPQFGGYCAYGVSKGGLYPIEPDAFQIVDGRLLLQYNKRARDQFNEDMQGNLKKADSNWPGLVEKKGK